jgi:hypothetical protein
LRLGDVFDGDIGAWVAFRAGWRLGRRPVVVGVLIPNITNPVFASSLPSIRLPTGTGAAFACIWN